MLLWGLSFLNCRNHGEAVASTALEEIHRPAIYGDTWRSWRFFFPFFRFRLEIFTALKAAPFKISWQFFLVETLKAFGQAKLGIEQLIGDLLQCRGHPGW